MISAGGQAAAVALAGAGIWGAADFCGGLATRRTSSANVLMVSHGLAVLVLLAVQLLRHAEMPTQHTAFLGLIAGLLGGIGLLALYHALSLGSMGLVAALSGVLTASIPVIVSFFSEGKPAALKLGGFAVAGVAIWLIAYTPGNATHPSGLGLAVLAGLCFGILLVLLHIAGKGSIFWALTFLRTGSFSCAAVLSVFTALVRKQNPKWRRKPERGTMRQPDGGWRDVLPLAAAAGLLDTTGSLLFTVSSLAGRLDVAAVLASLYPAGTILLAVWLLKERATRSQTAGMALALVAVVMISA